MIRKFLISTSQMTGAVAIRAMTALALNKVIAVFAGPSGITLFSHLQNLLSIVIHLPQDGINKGYIKLFHSIPGEERPAFLKQVLLYNLIVTIIPIIAIALAHEFFWGRFGGLKTPALITIFYISCFLIVWSLTFLSYFQALRKFSTYSIVTAITSLLILIVSAAVLYFSNFQSFMLAYLGMQAFGLFISGAFYIKHEGVLHFWKNVKIEKAKVKLLLEYIMMAVSVLLFTYLTDFFVRHHAMGHFGIKETGYWQTVVRLSDYYKALFTVVVGAVFYAELTARISDRKLLRKYFKRILLFIIPALILCFTVLYLLRYPVIILLFDRSFIEATKYLPYQLGGDFFALIAYLFNYLLMAEKRTWTFIMVQGASTISYLILIAAFIPVFELDGLVMAHFYRNIFFLALVVVLNKKLFI